MASRTCLLCGKALGRFAAAGEDFCSREHRNQYRLRQGMERLAEANQVASVMRRRESPRQIPLENLRAAGETGRREFPAPRPRVPEARIPQVAPKPAGLPATPEFLRPMARGVAMARLLTGPVVTITAAECGPSVNASLYAHVAPAPVVRPQPAAVQVTARRRVAVAPKQKSRKAVLRETGTGLAEIFGAPAKKLNAAVKGRALRVSLSTGFRLPEWHFRTSAIAPPSAPGMCWPELMPIDAFRNCRSNPAVCTVDASEPELRVPRGPAEVFQGNFRWPGTTTVSIEFVDAATGRRSAFVPFGSEERR